MAGDKPAGWIGCRAERRTDMANNEGSGDSASLSVPVGIVAAGLLLGLAGATYFLTSRSGETTSSQATTAARTGRSMMRRAGIMTLVTLIENDATRKLVVAALRAMARRS
jgi:hypothetical protein